jgi:acetoin utilization protein AcuC
MSEATIKTVLIHDDQYANWVLGVNHPTQGRRFINAKNLFIEAMKEADKEFRLIAPRIASVDELERVHSSSYVEQIVKEGMSSEWSGERLDLSELARVFAGGTLTALEELLAGRALTAIHFPGAKHHAQVDHSSGFCVFADFALAADIASKEYGKRVAILDIDAHHGDGTENLSIENSEVLTFSIHEFGIFPGTGNFSIPEKSAYNYPLFSKEEGHDEGRDDQALLRGVEQFISLSKVFNPEVIFIACGADGHSEDPLSSLAFSVEGFKAVGQRIREVFPDTPILIGGAGGYLPDTRTPEVWSSFAQVISIK